MTGGFVHLGVIGPGLFQELREAGSALVHIGLVFRFGADGGNSEKGEQFLEEPFLVVINIGFHLVVGFYKDTTKSCIFVPVWQKR